jgi:hypothetical protein
MILRDHARPLLDAVLRELLAEIGQQGLELIGLDQAVAGLDHHRSGTRRFLLVVEDAVGVGDEEGRLDRGLEEGSRAGVEAGGDRGLVDDRTSAVGCGRLG